jgi:8-oxo-dGTP pyrophosphatase MutT (NUDIX family)
MDSIWYVVNVEGVIFRSDDCRYLMITRGSGESYLPGVLTLPGGKVEDAGNADNILEETLRREIREEVGGEVHDEMVYLESKSFVAEGDVMVDVVFLCRYLGCEAAVGDPDEVDAVHWMTAEEIIQHPKTPPWTRQSIEKAEKKRTKISW